MALFSGIRDATIQMEVKRRVRNETSAITDMKNLEIDSKQKSFSLKLELAGESEALAVTGNYSIVLENGKTFFSAADIKTSKEWLTILAVEFVEGRKFEVPSFVRIFL